MRGWVGFIGAMKIFLALLLALSTTLSAHADPAKWEGEIAAFEAGDGRQQPEHGGIVFVGSSSIRLWKTLAKDFPEHRVLNRGFGGSELADSVAFAERIIFPYEPRMVVLYAGGNDISNGKSAQQVFEDFREFVAKVRSGLPEVEIAYISIAGNPARWAQVEEVKAANRLIEDYAKELKGVRFINVFAKMLDEGGQPRGDIFVADKLHMNEAGYKIWADVVRPFLGKP